MNTLTEAEWDALLSLARSGRDDRYEYIKSGWAKEDFSSAPGEYFRYLRSTVIAERAIRKLEERNPS